MIEPYFETGFGVLYHGKSENILPTLPYPFGPHPLEIKYNSSAVNFQNSGGAINLPISSSII